MTAADPGDIFGTKWSVFRENCRRWTSNPFPDDYISFVGVHPPSFSQRPRVRSLTLQASSSVRDLAVFCFLPRYRQIVMALNAPNYSLPIKPSPSEPPFRSLDNPGDERVFSKTPFHARKIVALPRYVQGKEVIGKSSVQGNGTVTLNHFRSLVASPATPNTPTPAAPLESGYSSEPYPHEP